MLYRAHKFWIELDNHSNPLMNFHLARQDLPEYYIQKYRCKTISSATSSPAFVSHHLGSDSCIINPYRIDNIMRLMEGWSGTTRPLQLWQPGSTPGPFATSFSLKYHNGGFH